MNVATKDTIRLALAVIERNDREKTNRPERAVRIQALEHCYTTGKPYQPLINKWRESQQ